MHLLRCNNRKPETVRNAERHISNGKTPELSSEMSACWQRKESLIGGLSTFVLLCEYQPPLGTLHRPATWWGRSSPPWLLEKSWGEKKKSEKQSEKLSAKLSKSSSRPNSNRARLWELLHGYSNMELLKLQKHLCAKSDSHSIEVTWLAMLKR